MKSTLPDPADNARSRSIQWLVPALSVLALGAAFAVATTDFAERQAIAKLERDGLSLGEARLLSAGKASPERLLAGAEALDLQSPDSVELARKLTRSSLAKNPDQPFGWALLAYIETKLEGRPTAAAVDAISRSIQQCGYCDKELMRWRLNFVLQNWSSMPEEIRLDVFRGVDFLRWWHLDYEFIARSRIAAEARGIPFSDYQRAVGTSVRPQELPR